MRNKSVIGSVIGGSRIFWVNLLERQDYLVKKANYCLSSDDVSIRFMISMGIGAVLLMLRIALFGLPHMGEKMLASTSLTIAGIIMYWPMYIVASTAVLIAHAFWQKRKIEKELKEVKEQIEAYRLCW